MAQVNTDESFLEKWRRNGYSLAKGQSFHFHHKNGQPSQVMWAAVHFTMDREPFVDAFRGLKYFMPCQVPQIIWILAVYDPFWM